METVNITINDTIKLQIQRGRTVKEILKEYIPSNTYSEYLVVLNGQVASLNTKIENDTKIVTINDYDESSKRAYENTVTLILTHAAQRIYPEEKLIISHSICEGLYCEFQGRKNIDDKTIQDLYNGFSDIVKNNLEISPFNTEISKAIEYLSLIHI